MNLIILLILQLIPLIYLNPIHDNLSYLIVLNKTIFLFIYQLICGLLLLKQALNIIPNKKMLYLSFSLFIASSLLPYELNKAISDFHTYSALSSVIILIILIYHYLLNKQSFKQLQQFTILIFIGIFLLFLCNHISYLVEVYFMLMLYCYLHYLIKKG